MAIVTAEKRPFLAAHLGTLYAGGGLAAAEPAVHRATSCGTSSRTAARGSWWPGEDEWPVIESLRPSCPSCARWWPTREAWDAPEAPLRRARRRPRRPLPDALQLGHDRAAQGGRAHARQPRRRACAASATCWRFTPDDVLVNVLPLFHIHGLSFATHLSLLTGCRMHRRGLVPPATDARRRSAGARCSWRSRRSITPSSTGPSSARRRRAGRASGSSPAARRRSGPEVLPELESILGRPVINRYGMTEGHVITSLPLDGPWPQGSVGLPLRRRSRSASPATTARPPPPGEVGSVLLRGPNLFREYWRNARRHPRGVRLGLVRHRRPRARSTTAGSSPWSAARTT